MRPQNGQGGYRPSRGRKLCQYTIFQFSVQQDCQAVPIRQSSGSGAAYFFHGSGAGSFLPTSCLGPLGSHQTRSNAVVFILSTYFLHTFYLLPTYFLQFKKLFYKLGPKPAPDNQKRAGSGSSSGSATLVNRLGFLSLSIGSAVCIWLDILLFHLCPHLP